MQSNTVQLCFNTHDISLWLMSCTQFMLHSQFMLSQQIFTTMVTIVFNLHCGGFSRILVPHPSVPHPKGLFMYQKIVSTGGWWGVKD